MYGQGMVRRETSMSEDTANAIDAEMRRLVDEARHLRGLRPRGVVRCSDSSHVTQLPQGIVPPEQLRSVLIRERNCFSVSPVAGLYTTVVVPPTWGGSFPSPGS